MRDHCDAPYDAGQRHDCDIYPPSQFGACAAKSKWRTVDCRTESDPFPSIFTAVDCELEINSRAKRYLKDWEDNAMAKGMDQKKETKKPKKKK
jgi:hypothetical protein